MKIACIFPGFGSQYVGMGKDVYDNQRIVQEYFEEAYNCLDLNFVKLCFASSDEEISILENSFLGLFLVNSSLFALLRESGINPDWVAGYGMGAYSAMYSAGAFTFPDGLYLIKKLSAFYKEHLENNPKKAIFVPDVKTKDLEELLKNSGCEVSVYHSIDSNYVIGSSDAITEFKDLLSKDKVKAKDVAIENCLTSSFYSDVVDNFKIYLEKVDFKDLKLPYCSSSNKVLSFKDAIKKEFISQITNPSKWASVSKKLKDFDLVIEVGPSAVLKDLIKINNPELNVVSFNKSSDIEKVKALISVNSGDQDGSTTTEE